MNCWECRPRLSEHIDGMCDEGTSKALAAHLAECEACRTELAQLTRAAAIVRETPPVKPPQGLHEAILARLAAVPGAENRARRCGLALLVRRPASYAAAAVAVLCVLAAAFALRERGWRVATRGTSEALQDAAAAHRTLADEVQALRVRTAALDEALDRANRTQEALRGEVATLNLQAASAHALAQDLDAARSRGTTLEEALARVEKQSRERIAALERALAFTHARDTGAPPAPATRPPQHTSVRGEMARIPAPAGNVFFVDHGDRFEIQVSGPRDAVIAELFSIAADEGNPATADLAFHTLENLLGGPRRGPAEDALPAASQIARWWTAQIDDFGIRAGADAPVQDTPDRRRRERRLQLKALEDAWHSESSPAEE